MSSYKGILPKGFSIDNASQELNTTNNSRATDILPNPCTNNPLVLLTFDAS
jgi:hypothetical protein